jgi:hypothetical protein
VLIQEGIKNFLKISIFASGYQRFWLKIRQNFAYFNAQKHLNLLCRDLGICHADSEQSEKETSGQRMTISHRYPDSSPAFGGFRMTFW